ncbi:MAG: TetR family transcriptional regulator [Paucibacter sp.]|nr:TetR family transcriptional regulator [Roseateles sp.]
MVRKTKQEAQETREKLLDAAETLFHREGVSRTSLQQIAQEAGLTRGAVYWHFKDKAELFDAMMRRATMPLEQGVRSPAGTGQAMSLTELRWGLLNVFWSAQHQQRTRRVFEIAMQKVEYTGEMSELRERKLAARRAWREHNRAAFERAKAEGLMPQTLDARVAAIALMSLVDGLLHHWIADPEAFDLLSVGRSSVEGALASMARSTYVPLLPPLTPEELARFGQEAVCRFTGTE